MKTSDLVKAYSVLLSILLVTIIVACSMQSQRYNRETHPDSLIIAAFDEAGVNPEMFAQSVLAVLQYEIEIGKYQLEDVQDYLDIQIARLSRGVTYFAMAQVVDEYKAKILAGADREVSLAANLALIMLGPSINSLRIDTPIGLQDGMVVMDMFRFLQKNLSKY